MKLGEVVKFQNGYAFKSSDFKKKQKYKVIKIKELKNGEVKFFEDTATIDNVHAKNYSRYEVNKGDVLFALTGDSVNKNNPLTWVGRVAIYNYDEKALLNQRVCKMIPIGNVNCKYIYYYFCLYENYYALAKQATGSANQVNISTKILEDVDIELPDREIQDRVVKILDSLTNKILINQKINNNLFQQAQALYRAYFIDMQPFEGVMPINWHRGTASEIIELHDSKRIPLSSRERAELAKIYPYYGATSIMDYVDKYLFDGIYLLLGEDGTVIDNKGFPILQYVEGKFWVNNHTHVITGKNGFNVEMLYLLFSLTSVQSIVTGAVQPKISQANLNKVSIIIPSEVELRAFDAIIQPIFAYIRNLRTENTLLTTTRDVLLAKLMSQEQDVISQGL